MRFYNTKTRQIDEFTPLEPGKVTLYTCGPTVYNYLHVGNWVAYIRWDILVRTLQASGFDVSRVMNITDVGHLVSDGDDGEDKMEKGAKREGKTAWEVAEMYTNDFLDGMKKLNLVEPTYITKATDYIPQQIALVKTLEDKGFAYTIDDGVYFDTSKFEAYADFAKLNLEGEEAGARVEFNPQKRNTSDFALWKFNPNDQQRHMEWWAPWESPTSPTDEQHVPGATHADAEQGAAEHSTESYVKYDEGEAEDATQISVASNSSASGSAGRQGVAVRGYWGFPGWHLECSAMAIDKLGETIDIHTGGIDHIPVHHTNEIAQSEAATGRPFANYWLHNNFLLVDGTKVSKSLGNTYELSDLAEKGFTTDDFRLFVLQSHYRNESNFTWDNLQGAKNRLQAYNAMAQMRYQPFLGPLELDFSAAAASIAAALQDDLNTPAALTLLSEVANHVETNGIATAQAPAFTAFLRQTDVLLGFSFSDEHDITTEQKELIYKREQAREGKDWQMSDELRDELLKQGVAVRDTPSGTIWSRT